MNRFKKAIKNKKILILTLTIILFVVISYFSKKYAALLGSSELILGPAGEILYILIMATAVIIAPLETLPLLPIAAILWGPNQAAILTSIGWTIGSLIAFTLARKFGRKFVYRISDKYHIKEWAEMIKPRNRFWLVAFARFVLPIDIISYAVGLFTRMHWGAYLAATLIGIIPFAYLFTYGSQLRVEIQTLIAIIAASLVIFRYNKIRRYIKEISQKI
ncbi:VTT domain-containing protein [Candidatus Parcubacteria bacterium]|nr:VTT domain-containing protein [Candidatus Parcubacteria bacterium]